MKITSSGKLNDGAYLKETGHKNVLYICEALIILISNSHTESV